MFLFQLSPQKVIVEEPSGVALREGMCELHSGGQGAGFTHTGHHMSQ